MKQHDIIWVQFRNKIRHNNIISFSQVHHFSTFRTITLSGTWFLFIIYFLIHTRQPNTMIHRTASSLVDPAINKQFEKKKKRMREREERERYIYICRIVCQSKFIIICGFVMLYNYSTGHNYDTVFICYNFLRDIIALVIASTWLHGKIIEKESKVKENIKIWLKLLNWIGR